MRYLLLLRSVGEPLPPYGTPEYDELYAAHTAATGAMVDAGVMVDCAPLHAAGAATTVRVRRGETLLTDGPAAEIREELGGYAVLDCADLDDALKWAATFPAAALASVEVRPVLVVEPPA
jgi:hypothetical protein